MPNPKLRFFDASYDDWHLKRISDILTIKHGKDYKGISSGNVPVLGTGGEICRISKYLCDWPCVLIGRKGTINKPQYRETPFWAVDTLFYSRPESGNDPKFQYYLFQTIKWMSFNEASGVPSLSASTIGKIEKFIPSLEEQQKIATFFSTLDEKISLSEQKLEALELLKNGLMQKIFNREIRFKQQNGEYFPAWETLSINEVATVCGGGTPSTKIEQYWGGNIQWLTPTEINTKYVHESIRTITKDGVENSSAKLLPKGAILLTTRATIGACSINNFDGMVCTNQGFQSLICKSNVLPEFLYYAITYDKFQKMLIRNASGSTFLEISSKNLKKLRVQVPSLKEQMRIANFLSVLDSKIELAVKYLNLFKKLKSGFMQQMFV